MQWARSDGNNHVRGWQDKSQIVFCSWQERASHDAIFTRMEPAMSVLEGSRSRPCRCALPKATSLRFRIMQERRAHARRTTKWEVSVNRSGTFTGGMIQRYLRLSQSHNFHDFGAVSCTKQCITCIDISSATGKITGCLPTVWVNTTAQLKLIIWLKVLGTPVQRWNAQPWARLSSISPPYTSKDSFATACWQKLFHSITGPWASREALG
jgi:hypothetical protein